MSSTNWARCALVWITLALASCSDEPAPQVGGESHWLAACSADPECGDPELSCVCGTCTRVCSRDAMCGGGPKAACFDPDSPLLLQRCEERSATGAGVCLLSCRADAECGDARACMQGACVPAQPGSDAGENASIDAGKPPAPPPGPSTQEFDDLTTPTVSWSQPVEVPTPATTVAGADERILGTWREQRCDTPVAERDGAWTCLQLELRRGPAGEVTGSFELAFDPEYTESTGLPPGPYAAPTDPDVGWPTELALADYAELVNNMAEGNRYRMLDARFEDSRLSYAWSPFDVWREWCAMQRSYAWDVDGHGYHFCVPQGDEAQAGIDEGKLVLCTSADFEPLCIDAAERVPCVCQTSPMERPDPRCSPNYCRCDETGCDAHLLWRRRAAFELIGEQLVGRWVDEPRLPIELVRVEP